MLALTSPLTYVRFHGRNAETWNVRGKSAAERFDYLYSEEELEEWVDPLRELAEKAEQAYVLFNNNNRSRVGGREVAQAPTNAEMLRELLEKRGVPVSCAAGRSSLSSALNSSGCSRLGRCRERSKTTRRPLGDSSANTRASSTGK